MIWQDITISIANLLFIPSLFNQVFHGFKKKKGFITLTTSGITTLGLYSISFALFTLKLFLSAILTFLGATLWLILFTQGIIYSKI